MSYIGFNVFLESIGGQFLLVLLIFLLTFLLEKLIRHFLHTQMEKARRILKINRTQDVIIRHLSTALIYFLGIGVAIYAIPSLRTLSVSLFAGAGVIAIIVGFASQQAFSNVISGIFIAIFSPFRVDDIIELEDTTVGRVEDISLRHTVIRTFENKRVVVPNSIINNEKITNFDIDDSKICRFVEFSISYDSDINLAMKIMREESEKHQLCVDVRSESEKEEGTPKVRVVVLGFGDSSVNLRAWVWAKNGIDAFHMGWDLNKLIKERFDKEGVEIPFPYRTLVYKKDLPKNKKLHVREHKHK